MESNRLQFCRLALPTTDALSSRNFASEKGGCSDSVSWLTLSYSFDGIGANVNEGRGQDTPLHAVAGTSSRELALLLMDFGADTQARNADGKRPLELVPAESPLTQIFLEHEGTSPLPGPRP